MKDELLHQYFSAFPWQRQLEQLRKKGLAGYANGIILLRDASPEECRAAEGLLGRRFAPPLLRYKVSDFERALQASRFAVTDMAQFWLRLDGSPLLSRQQQRSERQDEIQAFFSTEASLPHEGATINWLHAMEASHSFGFQILHPHIGKGREAAHWLHIACCALDRRQQYREPEELALCSYAVSTDPHALDAQAPAGRLLLHALAHWQSCPAPDHGRARMALLRRCGLMQDDISDFTVQRGLILTADGNEEHPAYRQLRQQGRFSMLTSSQLEELTSAVSPTGRAYLLENQMVFSSLCRATGLRHPLICSSGQLKEASWQLLDLLVQSGCTLYYAGDFDPEGLSIADRLWKTYGSQIHMWHMSPDDYQRAISQKQIAGTGRLQQLEAVQCPALRPTAQAILQYRLAGYQEALVSDYLTDLRRIEQ